MSPKRPLSHLGIYRGSWRLLDYFMSAMLRSGCGLIYDHCRYLHCFESGTCKCTKGIDIKAGNNVGGTFGNGAETGPVRLGPTFGRHCYYPNPTLSFDDIHYLHCMYRAHILLMYWLWRQSIIAKHKMNLFDPAANSWHQPNLYLMKISRNWLGFRSIQWQHIS